MRFGLLGTGYWAREVHAAALAAHPEVDFVAAWGRDPAKAADLAHKFGITACPDLDGLLREVDAVAIALPPDVQADLALRAARAGKHLLLDKPLALSVAAADAVVDEVRARGLASIVYFTHRFQPVTIEALSKAKQSGGWFGGQSFMLGSLDTPGSPYAQSLWRREHGGLWDLGPHALSLLIEVLGPVETVTATLGPRQTTFATLRHTTEAVSTMALSLDAPLKAHRFETSFGGETGWFTMPGFDGDAVGSLTNAITRMLAEPENPLDVRFGREVVQILARVEESLRM